MAQAKRPPAGGQERPAQRPSLAPARCAGPRETTSCGCTVLSEIKETSLHGHRLAEYLNYFLGAATCKKKKKKNKNQPFSTIYIIFKNKFH